MLQSQFCEMRLNGKSGNIGSELPIGPLRLLKIKSNRIFEAYMRSNMVFEDDSQPRIENGNENYTFSPSSNNKKRACPSTTNSSSGSSSSSSNNHNNNNNNNNDNNNNSRLVKNSKGLQTTDRMKISSISTSSRNDFEDLSIDINEDNPLLQTGIRGTKRNTSVV